jgi:uncharacterized protein
VTTYVDTSALIKLYVDEHDSDVAHELVNADPVLATSWLTTVELRRNLARLLEGAPLAAARRRAEADLDAVALISLEETGWRAAADIAEELGVRSLDAVHLAAARQLRIPTLTFCTFDLRQGQAARRLGLTVVGC